MRPFIERAIGSVLPAAAVAWAVLVVAAPWLASASGPADAGMSLSALVYGLGALVCHQQPDRSFHLAGAQLPVCARCTGLYLSAALGIVFAWARARSSRPLPFAGWRMRLVWAALPTVATVAFEWWRPGAVSSLVRAAAAAPLGAAVGVLLGESTRFRGRLAGCERTRQSV